MSKNRLSTRNLAIGAMVAGIYMVLTLIFPFLSYGPVQIRFSEALTLLAVFSPTMMLSVTFGCFFANLFGFAIGANPFALDILFGTLATGLATIPTYFLRNFRIKGYPIASGIPPVLVNALIIGAELTWLEAGGLFNVTYLWGFNALSVGLGQVLPCLVLGPILVVALERTSIAQTYLLPNN